MTHTASMLETTPVAPTFDRDPLARCIDACFDCAQACTTCADACLAEESVADLRRCIRLNLDCADICEATGRALSRQTEGDVATLKALLEACAQSCQVCGEECEGHAEHHRHCRVCADACRSCEESCKQLLAA